MYIKTTKPTNESGNKIDPEAILNYVENIKEEISFRLENINKRIENIQIILNEIRGDNP